MRLLEHVLDTAGEREWESAVPRPVPGRPSDAPLLHGTVARINARHVRRLVRDLLREATQAEREEGASLDGGRSRRLDALGLLHAAITHDAAGMSRIADGIGVDADALAVIAQLAATPFLHTCATKLGGEVSSEWMKGYCPICGAWPAVAELRGLDRTRRLRCGRCAGDWPLPVLHCPFCAETRHAQLGALLPEGEGPTRRVDTCATCKGYLKTFTVLRPFSLRAVATEDLASVELDLIAQERGFARPSRPGYALALRLERSSALPTALEKWT